MSIPVPLDRLRTALEERGNGAYLLTASDDGRPHAVHVPVCWDGDALAADVGRRSATNATARSAVSLLYPVRTADDYSLIVDGSAVVAPAGETHRLRITPTRAVLHRPAPARDPAVASNHATSDRRTTAPDPGAAPDRASACDADCVPLLSTTERDRG